MRQATGCRPIGYGMGQGPGTGMSPNCLTSAPPKGGNQHFLSVSTPFSLPRDPVNLQVLQAFVDCHEFANLNLVQALR
jgi:hypothetical protein